MFIRARHQTSSCKLHSKYTFHKGSFQKEFVMSQEVGLSDRESVNMASERFTVNISGQKFEISKTLLDKFPDSTLSKACFSKQDMEHFFERPLPAFQAILEYYQTGSLHIPESRCFTNFIDELEFWGFSEEDITVCCQRKLMSFRADQKDLIDYEKYSDAINHWPVIPPSFCGCMSSKTSTVIWNVLDNYNYNLLAKIVFVISILVVLTSTTVSVLVTHDMFDSELGEAEWKAMLGDDLYEKKMHIIHFIRERKQSGALNHTHFNITEDELMEFPKNLRVPNSTLEAIERACTLFFTLEIILRLIFCPSFKMFFSSCLNIIDASAIILVYVNQLVNLASSTEIYSSNYLDVLHLAQVLRTMRLFRLTRNITGARVLFYSVRTSYKELLFMFVLLTINAITFGTIAYIADDESFDNISYATWWAIITMTTVGYGDVVPNSTAGRVVGVFCASMGIVILALTIPLFVNNFLNVYTFAKYKEQLAHDDIKIHPRTSANKTERSEAETQETKP